MKQVMQDVVLRAAVYARYSSDLQRDASIEDQVRLCREYLDREGWQLVATYTDHAMSGATRLRPGYQKLLDDARGGAFDVVLAEALDRLSRDQEDVAALYKQLGFAGVHLLTLAEGEISELHVGLKGTMNALFLKDLASKVRRGLRGRVEHGKAGGGNAYGYDVVRSFAADGEPVRGERVINPAEAAIVRRIFQDYAAGVSPKRIAMALNVESIPCPSGGAWGFSTINDSRKRGNGILNNELYIGRLVWNRQRFVKDPTTGKRVSRLNPQSEWIVREVPDLRIVDQELWNVVKTRQQVVRTDHATQQENHFRDRRRPKYLLSGLTICARCGGGYAMISRDLVGCATARNKGTCDNRLNIRRDRLEARVLDALRGKLMEPELFQLFCEEFTREVNKRRIQERTQIEADRRELARIERDLEKLVQALLDGVPAAAVKAKMEKLEARKAELATGLAVAEAPPTLLHPRMAEIYRRKVADLRTALNSDDVTRVEAAGILRSLIDAIVLIPEGGELKIELRGALAGILSVATNEKSPSKTDGLVSQVEMVAGVGFEPTTFRL
jgi:DNA invertase Pin-like site-specific DNA recombinase